MADITISDLELAPALTDDMVLPVENTTDTYAATLAMLRRLINKTFVEVENADFNTLTDDGFYQCTGTPTNSPVEGAINWTLQVSAESGVVVQRAFSLDDKFANLYIRRWNGVTWTGWLEVGAGALDNKANVSNTVTTDTAQTISGAKTFTANTIVNGGAGHGIFTIKNDVTDYGTSAVDLVVATSNRKNQLLFHFQEGNKWCAYFEQNPSTKNVTFIMDGCAAVYAPTPAVDSNDTQVATTAWVNAKKETIVGWGMPDYSAGVTMTTPYTSPKSGFIIGIHNLSDNGARSLTINGNVLYNNSSGASYLHGQSAGFCYPVAKGDVISWTNFNAMTFYPSKGVN